MSHGSFDSIDENFSVPVSPDGESEIQGENAWENTSPDEQILTSVVGSIVSSKDPVEMDEWDADEDFEEKTMTFLSTHAGKENELFENNSTTTFEHDHEVNSSRYAFTSLVK